MDLLNFPTCSRMYVCVTRTPVHTFTYFFTQTRLCSCPGQREECSDSIFKHVSVLVKHLLSLSGQMALKVVLTIKLRYFGCDLQESAIC